MSKVAKCHSDRKAVAKGLCKRCYEKQRYGLRPERKQKIVEAKRLRRLANTNEYLTTVYRLYGLHPNDYRALVEKQNGKCAICKESEKLVVDHQHGTEVVRGLLCTRCNLCLGLLEGSHKQAALAYLKLDIPDSILRDHLENVVNKSWNFAGRCETLEDQKKNAIIGLASEASEVLDVAKKDWYHTPKDRTEEYKKELGDVFFYLLKTMDLLGFSLKEVIDLNKEKLESRHPELGKVTERFGPNAIR